MVSLYFTDNNGNRELLGFYKTYDAACNAAYVISGQPKGHVFLAFTTDKGQYVVEEITHQEANVILSRLKFLHNV